MRREILLADDISKRIKIILNDQIKVLANIEVKSVDDLKSIINEVIPLSPETMERLFAAPHDKFEKVLLTEATEIYESRELSFGKDIMRKIEREIYLQILDNLWMQHLENMDHLREGIHWMSVGQRDPLVEYRRQSQRIFETMQSVLQHDIVTALFHAEPNLADTPLDTDLTRAARKSVSNADKITTAEDFGETDFETKKTELEKKKKINDQRKKAHKAERQRKTKARKKRK